MALYTAEEALMSRIWLWYPFFINAFNYYLSKFYKSYKLLGNFGIFRIFAKEWIQTKANFLRGDRS
jgi:hypothetical protein